MTTPKLAEIKTAIDNLAKLRSEYDTHINQFGTLKKNFNANDKKIDKFFGEKTKPDDIKPLEDITDQLTQLDAQSKTNIEDITVIKDDLIKIISRAEKVKIPHDANKVSNLVYTRQSGLFEWTTVNNAIIINSTVKGIYQLKIISPIQFNLSSLGLSGVGNAISVIIEKDATQRVTVTRADGKSDNVTVAYFIKFEAELK